MVREAGVEPALQDTNTLILLHFLKLVGILWANWISKFEFCSRQHTANSVHNESFTPLKIL